MPRAPRIAIALQGLLASQVRHDWSLEELREALEASGTVADRSSVSRALDRLERDGLVRRHMFGGAVRFEGQESHHEHLRCGQCGTIEEIPCPFGERLAEVVAEANGFRVEQHHLVVSGVCAQCSSDELSGPGSTPREDSQEAVAH